MSVLEHSVDARQRIQGKSLLETTAVIPAAIVLLMSMIAICNAIQPVGAERASSSLGIWVLVKLALAGCACVIGGWGVINSPRVRAVLISPPGLLLTVLAAVFLVTSVYAFSESAMISRAAAMILLGYLLFTVTALCIVGSRAITSAAVIGTTIFMLIAWVLFLFVPSLGRFHEYADAYSTVMRMGGITHPNALAREASICVLLCFAMLRTGVTRVSDPRLRAWLYAVIGLAILTLAATLSRTAVIALVAAMLALVFDQLLTRRSAITFFAGITVALAILFAVVLTSRRQSVAETAVVVTTKSGEFEELTSITGRTMIWAEAWDLIWQRPLLGWGLDSAASVMSAESRSTHNLLLHSTFSGGIVAGMLTIALLAMTLYHAVTSREPLYRGIATYVLVAGLVEDTVFESFPSVLTILWITVLLDPIVKVHRRREACAPTSTAWQDHATAPADAPARTLGVDSPR